MLIFQKITKRVVCRNLENFVGIQFVRPVAEMQFILASGVHCVPFRAHYGFTVRCQRYGQQISVPSLSIKVIECIFYLFPV